MRFSVACHQQGQMQYVAEESCPEGRRPAMTEHECDAFSFCVFRDAKSMADKCGGMVLAFDDPAEFRDMNEAAEAVDMLKADILFGNDTFNNLPRYAEQQLCVAISHLDIAHHHLKMGWMESLEGR